MPASVKDTTAQNGILKGNGSTIGIELDLLKYEIKTISFRLPTLLLLTNSSRLGIT
jgi:hypothetical protein